MKVSPSIALSLSLRPWYTNQFLCCETRKETCLKAEGESLWHLLPMTFNLFHSSKLHRSQLHHLLALTKYAFTLSDSIVQFFLFFLIYKYLRLLLILTINPVFFTHVSRTCNNVQRLKEQVLWRHSVRCCHSTDLFKMKSLWTGVSNRPQLFEQTWPHLATRFSVRLHHWKPCRAKKKKKDL